MIDIFKDMRFSINSKDVTQGTVFVALKGKNTDGHLFVDEALKNGAEYVVVEKSLGFTNDRIIRVNSTLKFLAELARKRLEEFNPLVIGITGSNGKTTMKELLYSVSLRNCKTLYICFAKCWNCPSGSGWFP